jgi:hypothetical protein
MRAPSLSLEYNILQQSFIEMFYDYVEEEELSVYNF